MRTIWVALAAGLLAGCGSGGTAGPVGSGAFVAQTVTPAGGTLILEGASFEIPAGALDAPLVVRLTQSTDATPTKYGAVTPLYATTPTGQVLRAAATLTIPYEGTVAQPTVIARTLDGTGWVDLGGTAKDGAIAAQILHFGRAFVADRAKLGGAVLTTEGNPDAGPLPDPGVADTPAAAVDAPGTDGAGADATPQNG